MKVEVKSMLEVIPDIIEGSPGQRDVTVGLYKTSGDSVRSSYIQGTSAPVRAMKPYRETSHTFGKLLHVVHVINLTRKPLIHLVRS